MSGQYVEKFKSHIESSLFRSLSSEEQYHIEKIAVNYRFSFQETKQVIEKIIDLRMWGEPSANNLWSQFESNTQLEGRERKKHLLKKFNTHYLKIKDDSFQFKEKPPLTAEFRMTKQELRKEKRNKEVFGMCAVQSDKTSCCNLRTIDAVKNCGFGCSYCSIQTMYGEETVVFDQNLEQKLADIKLDKSRKYHIGTGQASDSLMWGNQHGVLDSMLGFAEKWPNVLLEFKTKSKNVKYINKKRRPSNIVCSWSVNPQAVIENEEHLTSSLDDRLRAAEACVANKIKVGFHLHPMIFYKNWKEDYAEVIKEITSRFNPEQVLFVSFGSLTFSKPVIKKIRQYNIKSKMLQMPMVSNPEGKQTYPFELKKQMFQFAYNEFKSWHEKVYFFLCMEDQRLWDSTFGWRYSSNEEFEEDLVSKAFKKIDN